jgi:hypothetical protein
MRGSFLTSIPASTNNNFQQLYQLIAGFGGYHPLKTFFITRSWWHRFIYFLSFQERGFDMKRNLENLIGEKGAPNFKSQGERRIAYFLEDNSIRYQYEPGLLVNSGDKKPRIWYPDFYLPEFGTYIEYFGLAGEQNYDQGIRKKKEVYSAIGLDVIPIYPWNFCEDWQQYIMKEVEKITIRRYRNLMAKPYWSQNRSTTYHNNTSTRHGYHQGHSKHY